MCSGSQSRGANGKEKFKLLFGEKHVSACVVSYPNKLVENSIYISKAVLDFCHVLSVGI